MPPLELDINIRPGGTDLVPVLYQPVVNDDRRAVGAAPSSTNNRQSTMKAPRFRLAAECSVDIPREYRLAARRLGRFTNLVCLAEECISAAAVSWLPASDGGVKRRMPGSVSNWRATPVNRGDHYEDSADRDDAVTGTMSWPGWRAPGITWDAAADGVDSLAMACGATIHYLVLNPCCRAWTASRS